MNNRQRNFFNLTPLFFLAAGICGLGAGLPSVAADPAQLHAQIEAPPTVLLGIDVLEAEHFAPLKGKRIGLLTHPAGVDGHGVSTIEILRHAPGVNLVALFGTEHGVYGAYSASAVYPDQLDPRTGLMVYSLFNGKTHDQHKPTAAQLKGLDALVVDLQDIGTRSYTFTGAMKQAMEGCFANNVEVIILDRPNPLGGLKADGPMLDPQWMGPNLVNEFPVPYVHGLTIGELACMAKDTPGVLNVSDIIRLRGRLTIVPMVGWRRSMRWTETGLKWVPTSPYIPDFSAVVGYPMTGLGCYMGGVPPFLGGFSHGVGNKYPFRGISNKYVKSEMLEKELNALHLPGVHFLRMGVPNAKTGKPGTGVFIEVTDWDKWRPTELNFYLMKLDCALSPRNPFAAASPSIAGGFLRHMGSTAFFQDLAAHGARVDVDAYMRDWQAKDAAYQQWSRKFWLYY